MTRSNAASGAARTRSPADSSFRRLWAASTVSAFGDGLSLVALPWLALRQFGAGVGTLSVISALAWFPVVLLSIPAGAWSDRSGRPVLIMAAADAARCLIGLLTPVLIVAGAFTVHWLWATAFLGAAASVFFSVNSAPLLTALLSRERFAAGQSLVYGSARTALVLGSVTGGLLLGVVPPAAVIGGDAVTFLVSALLLRGIAPARQAKARPATRTRIRAGLVFLAHTPELRVALGVTTVRNLFLMAFHTVFIVYLARSLSLSSVETGIILAADAGGALASMFLARPISNRFRPHITLPVACVLAGLPLAATVLAVDGSPGSIVGLAACVLISGFGAALVDLGVGTTFARATPPQLRAGVRGAYQTVSYAALPIGSLTGGALGSVINVHTAMGLTGLGTLLTAALALRFPRTVSDGS